MNQLYPLKFTPILKDKIWGGSKLKSLLNKDKASEKAGESWEISGYKGDISVVSNGFLAGNSLQELIEVYMGDLVGQNIFDTFGTDFPLLLKYIDASKDLSIQVHPNDEQAKAHHDSFGKTEMWYVMQADKGAELISGFNQEVDKKLYLEKLRKKELLNILNNEVVESGDVYFMPAGRIHSIMKGCLVAEIQQTSDITYRVYDFDRRDDQGNTRDLHTEEALDVIDYNYYNEYQTLYKQELNKATKLAKCQYFTTNILQINRPIERDMIKLDSFIVYMCVEGSAEIELENKEITNIETGETVLIPAEIVNYNIKPKGSAKLLEVYIEESKNEN